MANNLTGNLRVGSVVKDKVMLNHEAKVVSIDGENLILESLNRRDDFHYSEHERINSLYKALYQSVPYTYIPKLSDFQLCRSYTEVELIKY